MCIRDSLFGSRLGDLLGKARSAEDLGAVLTDRHDMVAEQVRPLMVAEVPGEDRAAVDLLRDWDLSMTADSAPAALFWVALSLAVEELLPGKRFGPLASHPRLGLAALLGRVGLDPSVFPRGVLAEAFGTLKHLSGEDPGGWQWGAIHRLRRRPIEPLEEPTYMPVSGSPGTIEGYRLHDMSVPFEADVEPSVLVLSDLSSSRLEVVDSRGRTILDLKARPDTERVELVPG